MPPITTLFRPRLDNIPVRAKVRVLAGLCKMRTIETGNLDQIPQFVRVTRLHFPSVRELPSLSFLCDAGLQRTLHSIPSQVICAVEQPQLKQRGRLPQPDLREILEVLPIHAPSSYRLRHRCRQSSGRWGGLASATREVAEDRPCAWQLIYTRLKNINQLDRLDAIVPPKDWRPAWHAGARKIVREEHRV